MGTFVNHINPRGNSMAQGAVTMTGEVLHFVYGAEQRLLIVKPDEFGSFRNCITETIQGANAVLGAQHDATCATTSNDGIYYIWGAEYGDASAVSWVDPCNRVVNTVISAPQVVCSHSIGSVLDDGRHFGAAGTMPAKLPGGTISPIGQVTSNNLTPGPGSTRSTPDWTETGWTLIPDGRLVMFGRRGEVTVFRPAYPAEHVAAGSFNGDNTFITYSFSDAERLALVPSQFHWRIPNGATFDSSGYRVGYEIGAVMWSPKHQKVVCCSGSGVIWLFDPATNQLSFGAMMPLWPEIQFVGAVGNKRPDVGNSFGYVAAADQGKTVAQIIAQGFVRMDVSVTGTVYADQVISYLSSRAIDSIVWVFRRTGSSGPGNVASIRLATSGHTRSGNIVTLQIFDATNALNLPTSMVLDGTTYLSTVRPWLNCMDHTGNILPNGDIIFTAGTDVRASNTQFNTTGEICKWDGVSQEAVILSDYYKYGQGKNMLFGDIRWLPDGSLLVSQKQENNEQFQLQAAFHTYYEPDAGEATPLPGTKPELLEMERVLSPGDTFRIQGRRLCGVHCGDMQGDDGRNNSNIPALRLKNRQTGLVRYLHYKNMTYRGISLTRIGSLDATLPSDLLPGIYELTVMVNGVSSDAQVILVEPAFGDGVLLMKAY